MQRERQPHVKRIARQRRFAAAHPPAPFRDALAPDRPLAAALDIDAWLRANRIV